MISKSESIKHGAVASLNPWIRGMREAEDALHRWLADGPVEVTALKKRADEAGIGWRTLERAKRRLRVKTEKRGGPGNKSGPWMWRLSGEDRQRSIEKQSRTGNGAIYTTQRRPPAEDRQTISADFSEGTKEWTSVEESVRSFSDWDPLGFGPVGWGSSDW